MAEAIMDTEIMDMLAEMEVELKYCERCGGIWLRPVGGREIYCPPCIPKMAQIPFRGMKKTSVAYLNRTDEESRGAIEGHCAEILAFCPEGGNA
jgi:Zn-finger nucleic acid-binding protein